MGGSIGGLPGAGIGAGLGAITSLFEDDENKDPEQVLKQIIESLRSQINFQARRRAAFAAGNRLGQAVQANLTGRGYRGTGVGAVAGGVANQFASQKVLESDEEADMFVTQMGTQLLPQFLANHPQPADALDRMMAGYGALLSAGTNPLKDLYSQLRSRPKTPPYARPRTPGAGYPGGGGTRVL